MVLQNWGNIDLFGGNPKPLIPGRLAAQASDLEFCLGYRGLGFRVQGLGVWGIQFSVCRSRVEGSGSGGLGV